MKIVYDVQKVHCTSLVKKLAVYDRVDMRSGKDVKYSVPSLMANN